jgi:hypothetical protein
MLFPIHSEANTLVRLKFTSFAAALKSNLFGNMSLQDREENPVEFSLLSPVVICVKYEAPLIIPECG